MDMLDDDIDVAIESGRHFYIDITKNVAEHTDLEALFEAAGNTGEIQSGHPADIKAKDKNLKLVKIVRTQSLVEKSALKTYSSIIAKYFQDSLCINDNSGNPRIVMPKGFVYLRIYEDKYRCNYHKCRRSFKTEEGLAAHLRQERASETEP